MFMCFFSIKIDKEMVNIRDLLKNITDLKKKTYLFICIFHKKTNKKNTINMHYMVNMYKERERRWILLRRQIASGVVIELRLWAMAVSVNTLWGQYLIICLVSVF